MFENIVFSGVGTYHPSKEVDNNYFVDHFKKMDINVEGLMNHLGRKKRYFASENETVITMACEASQKALGNACLSPEDIDMIIFATDTPEYTCPTNALLLNEMLGAKNANMVFDINSNCIGMLTGIDVAGRLLKGNDRIKRALVVGGFHASNVTSTVDPVCYSNFADAAAAIVVEKRQEERKRGFLDSNFKTDPIVKDKFLFPKVGFSKFYDPDVDIEDKKLRMDPFDTSFISKEWTSLIKSLTERNNMEIEDIEHYFFSQFSRPDAESTLGMLGVGVDRHTFVGDKYGYTGVTSPVIALNEAINTNSVKEEDDLVFCSVGGGYNICAILYKM